MIFLGLRQVWERLARKVKDLIDRCLGCRWEMVPSYFCHLHVFLCFSFGGGVCSNVLCALVRFYRGGRSLNFIGLFLTPALLSIGFCKTIFSWSKSGGKI